ncbi:uncharacterized protein LOC123922956 [Trifolium pratense]|nr:uncharacterized protein LOC123922956 [Trifolium pratense]
MRKLSMHKNDGQMGFKSLHTFNLPMLGKQSWRVMSNPDILISKIYKAKYFPHCDFFDSKLGHNPSFVWRSICNSKFILRAGSRRRIGNGQDIPLFNENCLYDASSVSIQQTEVFIDASVTVANIIIPDEKCWNVPLITMMFEPNRVAKIIATPLYKSVSDDKRIWRVEINGICPNSTNIWGMCNFNPIIASTMQNIHDAVELVFHLLQQLNAFDYSLLDCRTMHASRTGPSVQPRVQEHKWKKPARGWVKCNVDASFSSLHNRLGIGICIRDEFGAYVLGKYEQFTPLCDVKIGEALGLLSALNWVHELNLVPVDFELDSKVVEDNLHSNKSDETELGDIIANCRRLFRNLYNNSSV